MGLNSDEIIKMCMQKNYAINNLKLHIGDINIHPLVEDLYLLGKFHAMKAIYYDLDFESFLKAEKK